VARWTRTTADEETVEQIRKNAYIQFFHGFAGYSSKAKFDPSMMIHLRKRFSEEDVTMTATLTIQTPVLADSSQPITL
jgi:IS5 family transposase